MSALAQTTESNTQQRIDNPSVTTISANYRIDYILRFAKQSIIVVDDNADVAAQVSSRFVDALPEEHNAAFLTVSPKLNDIQIRCRIFEQLFGNSLFDPEQSLAISLLNMAKSSNEAISIVVEQAQFLSLQILHELCQLAELAKKTNVSLNVLMSANNNIGSALTGHKALFKNKVSVLSAKTGQLVPLNAKQFRSVNSFYRLSSPAKWLISFLIVISVALVSFLEMHNQNIFTFSALLSKFNPQKNITIDSFVASNEQVLIKNLDTENTIKYVDQASVRDIYLALTLPFIYESSRLKQADRIKAEPTDIMSAISSFAPINKVKDTISKVVLPNDTFAKTQIIEPSIKTANYAKPTQKSALKTVSKSKEQRISADYFLSFKVGYAVQISGFSQRSIFNEFINDFRELDYYGYNRMLNDEELLVITSQVYPSRVSADKALSLLPTELQARGAWVKSVAAINNEIKAYKAAIR